MSGTTSIAFLLLCVAGYVFVRDVLRAPRMHSLRQRVKRERNRNRFGELRTRLVRLGATGELDPRSQLFQSIYRGSTNLMRNPHEMEVAAQAILQIPAPEDRSKRETRPTKAEGAVARDFARRIDLLCRDYSKVYVVAAWIVDRCRAREGNPPLWIELIQERERQQIKSMVKARKRLEGTALLAEA